MTAKPCVSIRPRRDEDLDELARILVEVHRQDGYPVEGVDDPYAWLRLESPLGAWVAELDGKVVGHVALSEPSPHDDAPRIWAEQTGKSVDRTAVLGRLFLAPTARGHAIGSRLTRTASDTATQLGRTAVLDVMHKDSAAIRLYEQLAWSRIGETWHTYRPGSREPAYTYALAKVGA